MLAGGTGTLTSFNTAPLDPPWLVSRWYGPWRGFQTVPECSASTQGLSTPWWKETATTTENREGHAGSVTSVTYQKYELLKMEKKTDSRRLH